jgi:hypothetical protein
MRFGSSGVFSPTLKNLDVKVGVTLDARGGV